VVGSVLVDAVRQSLDEPGKAIGATVKAVTDVVTELAKGVRSVRKT
jgi:tryptophan synthase alpha chain